MNDSTVEAKAGSKIVLALSGGGSRAIAFHLGCLRALHQAGILDRIATISSVSGGSVLAALYCSHPGNFDDFEAKVRDVLTAGLVRPALRSAFTTPEGLKALFITTLLAADRLLAFLVRLGLNITGLRDTQRFDWLQTSPILRKASRTTILRCAFDRVFEHSMLRDLRADRPKLIIVACELRTKSAFYFAADDVGSWRHGSADPSNITIAHAVTASACHPAFLPALDEKMAFTRNGTKTERRIMLTDGGIYDNLGLAPLWPDRNAEVSLHVDEYDLIIACRAGYTLEESPSTAFWPSRMNAAFESVHARAQNLAMGRLFDLSKSGVIKGFLLAYLGQNDARLAHAPDNFVTKADVIGYPTDFSAMSEDWIERLSLRGQQLMEALIAEHWSGNQA